MDCKRKKNVRFDLFTRIGEFVKRIEYCVGNYLILYTYDYMNKYVVFTLRFDDYVELLDAEWDFSSNSLALERIDEKTTSISQSIIPSASFDNSNLGLLYAYPAAHLSWCYE